MYKNEEPEINLEQLLGKFRAFFGRFGLGGSGGGGLIVFIYVGLIVAAAIWLMTGFYRIEAGEQGVVRQFGAFSNLSGPGLNWKLPAPITSLVKVNTERIRSTEIGFRSNERGMLVRDLDESLMLTTDNSIVEAQMNIQYRVSDPKDWVFNVKDPETVLQSSAEVALRSIIGRTNLITALTGRARVEQDTRAFLAELLDTYKTGIQLTEVKLQTVDPPDEVKDAFQEVTRALEDETKYENEALAYRADQIPRAQGQIQVLVQSAAGFHREQIEKARGEANRFLALLGEYRGSPRVTRERLYLETLENVLKRVDKTLIDPKVEVLPLLSLSGLNELKVGE